MSNVRRKNWTEEHRLLLLEAIVTVEEQIVAKKNRNRGVGESSRHSLKWNEVAAMLPDELVERRQIGGRQVYNNIFKCRTVFANLIQSYRHKSVGKNTMEARRHLTEPVMRLLKRFDDLHSGRCLDYARSSSSLYGGLSENDHDGDELQGAEVPVNLKSPEPREEVAEYSGDAGKLQSTKMVPGQSTSVYERREKVRESSEQAAHELQNTVRVLPGKSIAPQERGKEPAESYDNASKLQSTEMVPGQLRSVDERREKAAEFSEQVAHELQNTVGDLAIKLIAPQERGKEPAESSDNVANLQSTKMIPGQSRSVDERREKAAESSGEAAHELLNTVTDVPVKLIVPQECAKKPAESSKLLSTEGYADILDGLAIPSSANAPPTNQRQPGLQSRVVPHVSRSRGSAEPPPENPSRARLEKRAYTHESLSGTSAKSLSRTETHTRDQSRSSTKRPATDEGHLEATLMERPLRSLDREYSRLSSWVQKRLIPIGRSVSNDIISSEIGSKRRKSSEHQLDVVSQRFDPLIRKSVENIIENQMRASFHKLRTRFLVEMKRASIDIAKNVLQETDFPNIR